jgi:hypothetical protein
MINAKLRLLYSPGKRPPLLVQEAVWASEQVWIGPENLALRGVQTRGFRLLVGRYNLDAIPSASLVVYCYET